jgi:hypothetical protein
MKIGVFDGPGGGRGNIFSEQKTLLARIKQRSLVNYKIILEEN